MSTNNIFTVEQTNNFTDTLNSNQSEATFDTDKDANRIYSELLKQMLRSLTSKQVDDVFGAL